MSPDQKAPTPFIIEWIPDILPKSKIGEMRIKFEYGHHRNGHIEYREQQSSLEQTMELSPSLATINVHWYPDFMQSPPLPPVQVESKTKVRWQLSKGTQRRPWKVCFKGEWEWLKRHRFGTLGQKTCGLSFKLLDVLNPVQFQLNAVFNFDYENASQYLKD